MAQATKKKAPLVPKLRFSEFIGSGEWKNEKLDILAIAINDKALACDSSPILTLSCEFGLIIQCNYFGRKIASQDTSRYTKIIENDFVYNDRITTSSKYGTIKKLSNIDNGLVSPIYKCFRFKKEEISMFWEWYFASKTHEIELKKLTNEGAREGRYNISISKFLSIKVLRPSTPEQQRIADCLTSIDESITAESQKLEALTAHKKALMQKLFPAEGEKVPPLRFKEFAGAGDWEEKKLGENTLKVGSGITPTGGDKNYIKSGRPFVRSQNVGWGQLLLDDIVFISDEIHKTFLSSEIKNNDVLLNITGASIGRCALADSRIEKGNVNQHVCIIRTKTIRLLPIYLCHYILSKYGQKQIDSFQAGGNRQGLNFEQIKSFMIPFPPSKKAQKETHEEQQRIADCLASLDEYITAQGQKITLLKEHKKGLMQQLFPRMEEENV